MFSAVHLLSGNIKGLYDVSYQDWRKKRHQIKSTEIKIVRPLIHFKTHRRTKMLFRSKCIENIYFGKYSQIARMYIKKPNYLRDHTWILLSNV